MIIDSIQDQTESTKTNFGSLGSSCRMSVETRQSAHQYKWAQGGYGVRFQVLRHLQYIREDLEH